MQNLYPRRTFLYPCRAGTRSGGGGGETKVPRVRAMYEYEYLVTNQSVMCDVIGTRTGTPTSIFHFSITQLSEIKKVELVSHLCFLQPWFGITVSKVCRCSSRSFGVDSTRQIESTCSTKSPFVFPTLQHLLILLCFCLQTICVVHLV